MLNVSKLLKMAGISAGVLGTTWLVADWCEHCQKHHRGDRCPAQTIGAANHPHDCAPGYSVCPDDLNRYDQGRREGYNEAYRNFHCLQYFNEWECEGWDSDDEEEYIRQEEARLRELRRRRAHHHAQSEIHRREQAINNIQRMNTPHDLQAILNTLQNRVNALGFQIRNGQIVPQNNPCGGHNPYYGCNDYGCNDYGYNCHDDGYNYDAYGC